MARILLVDDDRELLDVLAMALSDAGHAIDTARDGREADRRLAEGNAELVVCDVNLPGIDGFTLVKRWRDRGVTTPILLLTSRDSEIDEALGLELGADDYMTKPMRVRVLLARIAALLRREQRRAESEPGAVLVAGHVSLDRERLELRYRGTLVTTTLSELRLIEAMVERPGIVLSRARLLEHVRGDDSVVDDRLIDTYVRRMRRKLEAIEPAFDRIETVTGAGYRWRA
ncbi:response regulator transcription factor [Sandaracinus amylolyticus]|uniref:DNA-binding response regulator ChvI n=1 Tax=Sandaracinus amylolyticus TaxID=927083 RepID=A0A0F6VYS2_9BACT|nr:response regulator transcription factor [Sandaracinus amylolyticus]AKF03042.1 DNA-binding response regulator ChvI [Sandaracinus amylolyticus]